jgi:hypothetical protein
MENQKHHIIKSLNQTKTLGFCRLTKATALCDGRMCRKGETPYWKSRLYEHLTKNATTTTDWQMQKLLLKIRLFSPAVWNRRRLPTIVNLCIYTDFHKYINQKFFYDSVSSIGSPCYALAWFLHNTIIPVNCKPQSSVWNSEHFI